MSSIFKMPPHLLHVEECMLAGMPDRKCSPRCFKPSSYQYSHHSLSVTIQNLLRNIGRR